CFSSPQLCGIALIALGIFVQIELKNTLVMTGPPSASAAPIVILSVGVIVFFISFFGCCGAAKENYCMVTTVQSVINDEIQEEMNTYNNKSIIQKPLDDLQKKYSCCGVTNYTDWFNVTQFKPGHVPASCCRKAMACTQNPTPENTFDVGCVTKIEEWLKKHIVIVAAVALGIAFFELLGIIFACCLMKGIRSGYEVM
ncbi:hypothetical protein Chor_012388, partial [Crotalus horridus]